MKKILLVSAALLAAALFMTACSEAEATPTDEVGLANPASVYCEEQGYTLELRTDEEGGMYGVCIFPDGSECEEWAFFQGECQPGDSLGGEEASPIEMMVYAWYGRVVSGEESSIAPSKLVLMPEGTGEVMVTGETGEIESQILSIRDKEPPANNAHFWGRLSCPAGALDQCLLTVTHMRVDGPGEVPTPENIDGWEGVIYGGPPGPRSGGDDYFALAGPFHIQYGIHGADEGIQAQIESYRDSGQAVRISGQLIAGIPDWNGTQIIVTSIEPVEVDPALLPEAPMWEEETSGWMTYTNERYGYSFSYPETATITELGVMGYPTDEIPEGMTSDEYLAQLEKEYGDNFCVEVKYALGYIYIAADWETTSKYGVCGRTGVGAGELVDKTEELVIGGVSYTFEGFEFLGGGEQLPVHNETLVGFLPDGTRIEFGASPRDDATFEDYVMKTRGMLMKIITTYQPIG